MLSPSLLLLLLVLVVVIIVAAAVAIAVAVVVLVVVVVVVVVTAVLICQLNQPTNFPLVTQIMYGVALETGARAPFLSHGNTF